MEEERLPRLGRLEELVDLVQERRGLFVRYSEGPGADRAGQSLDYESGLPLPGLAVNPLDPEPWWTRPLEEWLARQLCNYAHLQEEAPNRRYAWVLAGPVVGRGPDNEPLVELEEAVARLDDSMVEEAKTLYEARFEVGRDSTDA